MEGPVLCEEAQLRIEFQFRHSMQLPLFIVSTETVVGEFGTGHSSRQVLLVVDPCITKHAYNIWYSSTGKTRQNLQRNALTSLLTRPTYDSPYVQTTA